MTNGANVATKDWCEMSGSNVSAARSARAKMNVQAIEASWVNLSSLGVMLRPIVNEKYYARMVKFLDVLVDYVGDDEDHPLSSLKFPLVSSEFFLLREALGVSFGLRFLSTT